MIKPLEAKYTNTDYPGYSYGFLGEDINRYLSALSAGVDDTIGSTLKSIPTSELLGRLKPMIRERDFIFSLTFTSQLLMDRLAKLAAQWADKVPRQSAAYIIGTPYSLGTGEKEAVAKGGNPLMRWQQALLREVEIARSELEKFVKGDYFRSLGGISIIDKEDVGPATNSLDDLMLKIEAVTNPKNLNYKYPKFLEWVDVLEDSSGFGSSPAYGCSWSQVWNKAVTVIYQVIGKVLAETPYVEDEKGETVVNTVNKATKTLQLQDSQVYRDVIRVINAFVDDYVKTFEKFLTDLDGAEGTSDSTVVVRLYPRAAFIGHASPQLLTTKLSENSFLQTAGRPDNIMISMQDCIAFDTLDTQWAQLYREIFNSIVKCGSPECAVRLGRRRIPGCHLFATPQIPDTLGTISMFAVQFICTENTDDSIDPIDKE